MSTYPAVTTDREHTFHDPLSQSEVTLIVGSDRETTGVQHRGIEWMDGNRVKVGCNALAGVAPELDGAYCSDCGWQCRLSGAWFMDLWAARPIFEHGAEVDALREPAKDATGDPDDQ